MEVYVLLSKNSLTVYIEVLMVLAEKLGILNNTK